ncbi:hypothetical protein BafPKo_A0028 (plasmid) [Borreliella afzelii PKo]|uniref:Uncharacterized protein n=1 Tax=Borreliella afzelii (strain PKo) TaxID=390236 RepID=Q0SLX7_BORAP|nr:hypothetical protein BAPKO_2029 [Borreliella afzelii PKo]ACJ73577.1 conserved hypothetical protein [Borreliella afzelii ACA-1]AEL70647.1 hypothetical protein BafPKo_A0028 [Borreliella afzelii PKo]
MALPQAKARLNKFKIIKYFFKKIAIFLKKTRPKLNILKSLKN